ncbi:thioester reductase domain-containing protein [Roseateles sp. DB2]|uniref:thioester reductase domain-containing protein n=1 Tax=Roseateles sp. DB2 TaxID=3453717 RepID=UPI003EEE0512
MNPNVDTIHYLSPLQHGMLHHSRLDPRSGVYVEQFSCLLRGTLEWDRFCQAWQAVAQRHDVLKTLFMRLQEAQPLQVVLKSVQLPITQLDWSALDPLQQQVRFEDLLHSDRVQGFDAGRPPLMRLHLIRLDAQQTRFLWTYHHAILDGWSMPIVLAEVFEHYAGRLAGQPRPARDYRHYLAWLRQQDAPAALDFWKAQLAGYRQVLRWAPSMQPSDADADAPRRLGHWQGQMPPAWVAQAQQLCRSSRLTLNTLCQAAWALLLALHAGQDDLCYGMVVSGRNPALAGVERMVGLFINTLPMRVKLDAQSSVQDWLQGLQQQSQEVEARAYSALSEVLACSELPRQQALFDAIYVFENYPGQAAFRDMVAAHGLQVDDVRAVEETSYGLALIVLPGESLQFTLSHDQAQFSREAMASLGQQFQALLERLVTQPQAALGSIGLLPASVPTAPGDTTAPSRSLLSLLEERARLHPQRAALLAGEGDCCSHAQLLDACHQGLAAWRTQGLQAGDHVLLCPDEQAPVQSLAMLLSALAAGLDCLWPAQASNDWPPHLMQDLSPRMRVCAGALPPGDASSTGGFLAWSTLLSEAQGRPDTSTQAPSSTGTCSLLDSLAEPGSTGPAKTRLIRYTQAQLVQALGAGDAGSAPAQLAATGWLSGRALWSALRTLLQGGTLHTLTASELDTLLQGKATEALAFDSVLLSTDEARRLDRLAELPMVMPTPALACWSVDATTLSPAGQRVLQRLAPQARLQRDWHLPAHSLPHAQAVGSTAHLVLRAAPGTVLQLRDPHQHAAAAYARGQLQLAGASVPSLLRIEHSSAGTGGWLAGQQPRLLSGLPAWQGPQGLAIEAHTLLDSPTHEALACGGALERALMRTPGVRELALIEFVDDEGRWTSCLFLVPIDGADPAELCALLLKAAAAHGLQGLQSRVLPALPRLAGADGVPGRMDRQALLRLAQAPTDAGAHVPPRDELEQQLHAIWATLLKTPQISVHANYFDLGGQSLLASVMLFQIEEKLGMRLGMEQLMAGPTIAELAARLRTGEQAAEQAPVDLPAEAVLDAAITPAAPPRQGEPREVLLTGATGFLGAHLLAELLASTEARVHCLVRARDAASGHQRLVEALQTHGLWDPRHAARIVALPGDLGAPNLGLTPTLHAQMAAQLDAIYHNGAMVNFVYPYAMLKAANVDATADILRLACADHAKPVHYISTVGVLNRRAETIGEDLDLPFHDLLQGGYEQSKWVAEQLVAQAGRRGLPVCIYRPSRIVGHSVTGRMNTDDLFSRLIKGIAVFGKAPRDVGFDNILPVDLAARLIVEASRHPAAPGHAVHVLNPVWNSLDEVVDLIEARGFALERLPYEDWLAQLSDHVRQDSSHPLAMLIPVLHKLNPVADPSVGARLPIALDHLKAWAPRALAEGLRPAAEWLDRYFENFEQSGFLPSAGGAAPTIQSITQQER